MSDTVLRKTCFNTFDIIEIEERREMATLT